MTIQPFAYRFRHHRKSKWQLSHRTPRPIYKMGNLHKALSMECEPLYGPEAMERIIELECVVRLMCDKLRAHAEKHPDLMKAFQHGEDHLV